MQRTTPVLLFVACLSPACTTPSPESSSDELALVDGGAVPACSPIDVQIPLRIDRSFAVTDPTVLAKFGFARTMNTIVASATVPGETATQLYQQWMNTFGASDCPATNPAIDPQHFGEVCPRGARALATHDPINPVDTVQFKPVGLFNRFDLAPASGANCGEYRIVYEMAETDADINGFGFYIFEAQVANPQPALGIAGCRDIAKFWADRSHDPTIAATAAALERFYYTGDIVPGVGPVVDAHNYDTGQIRANMRLSSHLQPDTWQLREYKARRTCVGTCRLTFDHVTVKNNPANELFQGTHPLSTIFAQIFPTQTFFLEASDLNAISMRIPLDSFNEYESRSEGAHDVVYSGTDITPAGSPIRSAIQSILGPTTSKSGLTVDNILDRATTQTCAGCHLFSSNKNIGGGLVWPVSLGFVHVEDGQRLSPALTQVFLPHRRQVLQRFLSCHADTTDPTLTIGGSPVGAPN